jgi:hypothetical protein
MREFVVDLQWGCFVSGCIPVTHRLSARSRHVNELNCCEIFRRITQFSKMNECARGGELALRYSLQF